MFTKSLASLAAAALVASFTLTTTAEAGGCGGGYFKRPSASYAAVARAKQQARMRAIAAARQRQIAAVRQARIAEARRQEIAARRKEVAAERAVAARKQATETAIAEAKTEELTSEGTKPVEVAEAVEATDSKAKPAEKTTSKVDVAAAETTCKRYIPTVGTTVTVACDQK